MSKPRQNRTRKPPRSATGSRTIRLHDGERLPFCLSRAILFLAACSLFVPVIVNYDFYYPFIFLKSILFRAAVQLMACLYVILAAVSPSYRPRFNRIMWALVAYFGAMTISSLPGISVDAWGSWWGEFARMGGMFTQLHLLAYCFVLTQTLKRERDWLVLFTASLFSCFLMGFSGLVQHFNLNYLYRLPAAVRIDGATGNPNWFASQMVLNLFVVFWFLSRRDKKDLYPVISRYWLMFLASMDLLLLIWEAARIDPDSRIISAGLGLLPVVIFALLLHGASLLWFLMRRQASAGCVFFVLLGLYYVFWIYRSQTRSAVAGLIGSLTILGLFYLWAGAGKKSKLVAAGLLLIALLPPAILFLNRNSDRVRSNPTLVRYVSLTYENVKDRLLAWKAGGLGISDRPLFGWGMENYKNAFDMHFQPQLLQPDSGVWYDRAHNVIVDVTTTSGFLGLAAYSVLYGLSLVFLLRLWFRSRDLGNSLLIAALLLAYLFQSLFTFDTINTDGILFLLLAYISFLYGREAVASADASAPPPTPVSPSSWKGWALGAATAAIGILAFWHAVKAPYESNLLLNQGIALETGVDPQTGTRRHVFREQTVDTFQRAHDYQTTGRHLVGEEFASYALKLSETPDVPLAEKIVVIKRAVSFLEESIKQDPYNVRHYMFVSSLLKGVYELLRQSEPVFARSLAEKCAMWLEKAETLSPARPKIYFDRGQVLAALGRADESITTLKKGLQLDPVQKDPHMDLIAMYISAGRFSEAAAEWQMMKTLPFEITPADRNKVIHLYNEKKQFASMAGLYREQIEKTPNDASLLTRLAATYREMGDLNLARETALQAAALSPQIAAGLQAFLDSLKKPR